MFLEFTKRPFEV